MKEDTKLTKAGKRYSIAQEAHYTTKDIHKAFLMYGNIIKHYPDTPESQYSRSQVQRILKEVIPEKMINDTMDTLVSNHFSL